MLYTTLLTAMLAASGSDSGAPQGDTVAVVVYQALGVDASRVEGWSTALRGASLQRGFRTASSEVTAPLRRAAAMCGEDAICLATLGRRAEARWVVGVGLGKVGSSVLVNTLLVDTDSGRRHASSSRKVALRAKASAAVADALVQELFATIALPSPPTPGPAPPEDAPSAAPPPAPAITGRVPIPRPQTRTWVRPRPLTWAVAGLAAGLGAGGVVLGVRAANNFGELPGSAPEARAGAERRQRSLNLAADACVTGAVVSAAAATLLYFLRDRPAAEEGSAP